MRETQVQLVDEESPRLRLLRGIINDANSQGKEEL